MGFAWKQAILAAVISGFILASVNADSTKWTVVSYSTFIFLAVLSTYIVYAVFIYPKFLSPLLGLPEPSGNHWLNGQYPEIRAHPTGVPPLRWANTIPNNGLIRYLGPFNQERVLITNPKALSEVLVTRNYDFVKPQQIQQSIGRILGFGILFAEGDEHKHQRKLLMPAFAYRHIKDLYPMFWRKSREGVEAMCEQIRQDAVREPLPLPVVGEDRPEQSEKQPVAVMEAGQWSSRMTLDIIGLAGLGRDFGAIRDPDSGLIKTYTQLFRPSRQAQVLAMLGAFVPPWILVRLPIKRNDDVKAAAGVIRATCLDLIQEKKLKMARKEFVGKDILSVALESGGFSAEGLVNNLMTFLAAGHETTASALTWAVYCLCLFPDIQTKLRQETRKHIPNPQDDTSSSAETDQMPYLRAFCSEVLRYMPPVALTLRIAEVDTVITGVPLPKGTRLSLSPTATNKSFELWGPDADKFNPDRWINPKDGSFLPSGGADSNFSMMTFLHGPRSCIGMNFAKAEFACLVANWVGKVEFTLKNKEEMDESKVEIKSGVTQRPLNGMWVYARVLEGW